MNFPVHERSSNASEFTESGSGVAFCSAVGFASAQSGSRAAPPGWPGCATLQALGSAARRAWRRSRLPRRPVARVALLVFGSLGCPRGGSPGQIGSRRRVRWVCGRRLVGCRRVRWRGSGAARCALVVFGPFGCRRGGLPGQIGCRRWSGSGGRVCGWLVATPLQVSLRETCGAVVRARSGTGAGCCTSDDEMRGLGA